MLLSFYFQSDLTSESVEKLPIDTDKAYGKFKDKQILSGSLGKSIYAVDILRTRLTCNSRQPPFLFSPLGVNWHFT